MIRAIIFDCFGVLAEDGWLPFKRRYIGGDREMAQDIADLGKQNEYGMLGNPDYFAKAARRIGVDEKTLREAVGKQAPNTELFEFIKSELKDHYKIGLLSNANYDVVNELFTEEQARLFDASVLSYECRLVKPDPRMFTLICERLGVEPGECIFIDDVERYCEAAGLFGMHAVKYENPKQCQEIIKTFI